MDKEKHPSRGVPYVFECLACGRISAITLGTVKCPACGSSTGIYYPKPDPGEEKPDRKD